MSALLTVYCGIIYAHSIAGVSMANEIMYYIFVAKFEIIDVIQVENLKLNIHIPMYTDTLD